MRNRIFGLIGVLWGGSVLFSHFTGNGTSGSGPGLIVAGLLFVIGIYYLGFGGPTGGRGGEEAE